MSIEIKNYQAPLSDETFKEPFDLVLKKGLSIFGITLEKDNFFSVNPSLEWLTEQSYENPEIRNVRVIQEFSVFPNWLKAKIEAWCKEKIKTQEELISILLNLHQIQYFKVETIHYHSGDRTGYQIHEKNGKVYYYSSTDETNEELRDFNYLDTADNFTLIDSGNDWKQLPVLVREKHLQSLTYDRLKYLYDIALQNEDALIKRYRTTSVVLRTAGNLEFVSVFDCNKVEHRYLKDNGVLIPLEDKETSWDKLSASERKSHLKNVGVIKSE